MRAAPVGFLAVWAGARWAGLELDLAVRFVSGLIPVVSPLAGRTTTAQPLPLAGRHENGVGGYPPSAAIPAPGAPTSEPGIPGSGSQARNRSPSLERRCEPHTKTSAPRP
jgi:hypothetical protein